VSVKRRHGTLRKLWRALLTRAGGGPNKMQNGGERNLMPCGAAAFVTRPRVVGGL
jgi:hypothetical protein